MTDTITTVEMDGEFRICPACGYEDGFHSMFRGGPARLQWFFICPACHQIFDIGLTVPGPGMDS